MKRLVASIITLFFVCGHAGLPVAAYSCVESGEAGVVSWLATPPGSCYADSCCEPGHEPDGTSLRGEAGCCDLDVHVASDNNRILPPAHKDGQADRPAQTAVRPDHSRTDAANTNTPAPIPNLHASIDLPLLF